VLSYLPSGGDGELVVPRDLDQRFVPVSLAQATQAEGDDAARAHRHALGRVGATLAGISGSARVVLASEQEFDLADAVGLALARQARPDVALTVRDMQGLQPRWRRLCQNLGIRRTAAPTADTQTVSLTVVRNALSDVQMFAVARSLNAISDVLPRSFLQ
jgi:hypothetical protein